LFHSSVIACFNSSMVCANRLSTRLFMSDHKFSIGYKSGEIQT
jgi:hypothetical protein